MTLNWLGKEAAPSAPLPISVRAAMAAVSEIEAAPDRASVESTLAAFRLSPGGAAAWWDEPCSWIGGQRPAKLIHRGETVRLLMAVATAAIEAVVQMRATFGDAEAARGAGVMASRLRAAGAPQSIIRAIEGAALSGSILTKDLADG